MLETQDKTDGFENMSKNHLKITIQIDFECDWMTNQSNACGDYIFFMEHSR